MCEVVEKLSIKGIIISHFNLFVIILFKIFIFLFNYKAPKTSSSESVKGQDSSFEVILIKGTIIIIIIIIIKIIIITIIIIVIIIIIIIVYFLLFIVFLGTFPYLKLISYILLS